MRINKSLDELRALIKKRRLSRAQITRIMNEVHPPIHAPLQRDEARQSLQSYLERGPKPLGEVRQMLGSLYGETTLRRAFRDMDGLTFRRKGVTFWKLYSIEAEKAWLTAYLENDMPRSYAIIRAKERGLTEPALFEIARSLGINPAQETWHAL